MPLAPVEQEIQRFLASDSPEVICIRGKWGVGKTFAWNKYLVAARDAKQISLPRYSYVSLFGINLLEELRYSIFENSVQSSQVGAEPSLETLNTNAAATGESFGRRSLWFLQQLPIIRTHIGGLGPIWYLSVKRYVICLDDIERKGRGLALRDVFGLISQLKEQKACKVVIILNDGVLTDEKADFEAYFDKTIDASLVFDPTAEEATQIALTGKPIGHELISANCIILGISNIRVIKRIERLVAAVRPLLVDYDRQVFVQAVHSLTLFVWSKYEPDIAHPSISSRSDTSAPSQGRFRNSTRKINPLLLMRPHGRRCLITTTSRLPTNLIWRWPKGLTMASSPALKSRNAPVLCISA